MAEYFHLFYSGYFMVCHWKTGAYFYEEEKIMENWKNDMDNDFKEFDYFAKKSAKRIVIGVIGAVLVFGGIGIIGRKIDTEADRKIFKESTTYNESAAAFCKCG